jgi:hypothetical protein
MSSRTNSSRNAIGNNVMIFRATHAVALCLLHVALRGTIRRPWIGKSSRFVEPEALLLLQDAAILEGAKLLVSSAGRPTDTQRELHAHWRTTTIGGSYKMTKRSYVDVLLKILELIEGFPRGLKMLSIGLVLMSGISGLWLTGVYLIAKHL